MAIMRDCVYLSCSRCGHASYYPSLIFADGSGWKINTKLWEEDQPVDLCPECSKQWDDLVHKFLYEETV